MPGQLGLSERDDACRDLKKQLLQCASPRGARESSLGVLDQLPHSSFERCLSDPGPERLVRKSSSIHQPGGFRRQFLEEQGREVAGHPSLLQKTMPVLHGLLDPAIALPQAVGCPEAPQRAIGDGASDAVTVLVLTKTFLTGTLLIVPNGFRSAGLLGGIAVLLCVGLLEVHCMLLLVRCRAHIGSGTYAELAEFLGRPGQPILSAMLVVSQFGFVCAEQVYVADNVFALAQPSWPELEQWHLILIFQLVLVPLSWVRKLKFFAVTNLLGDALIVGCVAYLMMFGAVKFSEDAARPSTARWGSLGGVSLFFGNCVYVYEGINMVLPIYESHLQKENFEFLLTSVLVTLTVLFMLFGMLWYGVFGTEVASVATLNLPPGSTGMLLVPPLYALAALFTTPMLFFPIATVVEPFMFPLDTWSHTPTRRWSKNAFRSLLMALSACVASVGGQQLQRFLAVIGGLCCGPLAIIIPAALHWRIFGARGTSRALDALVIAVGVVITVASTATALWNW